LNPIESAEVELNELIKLFYSPSDFETELGSFQEIDRDSMPASYRQLLAHEQHMTVTVEQFHNSPIELQVLATKGSSGSYTRKILLRRKSDGKAVLFGIVRLDLSVLDKQVRQEIEAQQAPLGQVLIDHDVLRQVKLAGLFRIEPGRELKKWFVLPNQAANQSIPKTSVAATAEEGCLYGRTALIFCDGRPVIELLEIVSAD
jgi:hypothetical protein